VLSVSLGAVEIPSRLVLGVVGSHLLPWSSTAPVDAVDDQIVWSIRLPRALLGAVVGASLAVAGTTLQALVRNPLADPYVLGVSSGAALGAVVVLVLGPSVAGLGLPAAAFAGALGALALVYAFASTAGGLSPVRLVLAGVALSYVFSGLTSFVIFSSRNPQATRAVLFWLLGSLGAAAWGQLGLPTAALAAGMAFLLWRRRALNALVLGDETAATLGVDVVRLRRELLVVASLVTGVVVAISGGIGFVGLMVPHLVRLVVGPDHRRVLPLAMAVGALYLVLVDLASRLVVSPAELPLGIITSVLGAPLFLWLLRRRGAAVG
jgi:iron complex transport system permease protein